MSGVILLNLDGDTLLMSRSMRSNSNHSASHVLLRIQKYLIKKILVHFYSLLLLPTVSKYIKKYCVVIKTRVFFTKFASAV